MFTDKVESYLMGTPGHGDRSRRIGAARGVAWVPFFYFSQLHRRAVCDPGLFSEQSAARKDGVDESPEEKRKKGKKKRVPAQHQIESTKQHPISNVGEQSTSHSMRGVTRAERELVRRTTVEQPVQRAND